MTAEKIENTGRVRRSRRGYRQWTKAQKRQIVAETLVSGASVSVVARRHDINANQLFEWRRQCRRGEMGGEAALVPVGVIGEGGIVFRAFGFNEAKPCAISGVTFCSPSCQAAEDDRGISSERNPDQD